MRDVGICVKKLHPKFVATRKDSGRGGEGIRESNGSKLEDVPVCLDAFLHHPQLVDHVRKLRAGIGGLF